MTNLTTILVDMFVAIYLIAKLGSSAAKIANEPVLQFLVMYEQIVPGWLAT